MARPRDCTTCRQCIGLEGVELGKIKDHFIFTIESIGVYKPEDVFVTALEILEEKAKNYVIWGRVNTAVVKRKWDGWYVYNLLLVMYVFCEFHIDILYLI